MSQFSAIRAELAVKLGRELRSLQNSSLSPQDTLERLSSCLEQCLSVNESVLITQAHLQISLQFLSMMDVTNAQARIHQAINRLSEFYLEEYFTIRHFKVSEAVIREPKTWQEFKEMFEVRYPGFFSNATLICADLSPTERRVCMLMAKDYATGKIRSLLGISDKTLSHHRSSIRKKLNLSRKDSLQKLLTDLL